MDLKKIEAAVAGLIICFSSMAQSPYLEAHWFFGLGGGLNVSFDGSARGTGRYNSHMGAGWASDFYIGKWFSDFAGFRVGWQGLTNSDQFTDFGEKDFNAVHADIMLRPVKWLNPYFFGGYLKIDNAVPAVGAGLGIPININDKLSIVTDLKYAAFSHKAFKESPSSAIAAPWTCISSACAKNWRASPTSGRSKRCGASAISLNFTTDGKAV